MKIIIVIDSLRTGGAQKQALILANSLADKNYDVTLFLYHTNQSDFVYNFTSKFVRVVAPPRKSGSNGFSFSVLKTLVTLLTCDTVLIGFQLTSSIYCTGASIFRKVGLFIPCQRSSWSQGVPLMRMLFTWFTGIRADYIVANSYSHKQELCKLPFIKKKCITIYNGYNISSSSDSYPFKERDNMSILMVSRISSEKNGITLLKALKLFYKKNNWLPNVTWVGRADKDTKSQHVLKMVTDYLRNNPKILQKIEFKPETNNINALYRTHSCLVLPSIYEGLPNVMCEAMLEYCPVIASNICDHPLLLRASTYDLMFDPLSSEQLCWSLEKFFMMELEERSLLADKAFDYANKNLSVEKMVSNYISIFENFAT